MSINIVSKLNSLVGWHPADNGQVAAGHERRWRGRMANMDTRKILTETGCNKVVGELKGAIVDGGLDFVDGRGC
jgi:hypothetical protein